ncbi:MAG: acetate--CoA ligase family protein [Burkholderiales bacterium]|nr:acetate--CoA ligase family protein [Burkholderiales bacterium]
MSLNPSTRPREAPVDLSRFLNPRGVAIVGASNDVARIGGQPIRLLTEFGYAGKVYPVNPKYTEIRGLTCYPDLAAVPQPCDVALVALSAPHVRGVIEQCGKAGIPYALVLSAGFSEVGGEGKSLQAELVATAHKWGVRLVGPNCLGIMNLKDQARVGFGGTLQLTTLKPGPLAMVTQSGGFGFGVVAIACYYGLGFNYAVSTGNEADLSLLDWMADLLERPEVEILVAFMEGITDGRRMIAIGERALELGKPILVWKVGNTDIGRRAATSHTARLTAGYELFRAAFRRGGYIEIRDVDDLIDISKILLGRKLPAGNRVAVLTLSGGAGVLLADRCIEHGLALPKLSDATTAKLREIMVSFASADNPIDATAHGYNDNFASYSKAIREVLADPNIDQATARPPRGKAARPWAEGLLEMLRETDKPLVLNWPTAPDDNGEVMRYLEENGVPCIMAPGRAIAAMAAVTDFAQKCRTYVNAPKRAFKRAVPRSELDLPENTTALGEYRAKQLLARYGIPVVREKLLSEAEVEALQTPPLAFPLAVKIESPDVPHKTEAGAVRLNVSDLASLKTAAREVIAAARTHRPNARIEGVLMQEMASGLEVIVGAVNDAYFGPTVTFGLGGVFTELMKDVTHRFAPFDEASAREMICEIKGAPLLHGYRGQPPLDIEALAATLARMSQLIADHADRIGEIDVNPLFVRSAGDGVVAADALIVLNDGKS